MKFRVEGSKLSVEGASPIRAMHKDFFRFSFAECRAFVEDLPLQCGRTQLIQELFHIGEEDLLRLRGNHFGTDMGTIYFFLKLRLVGSVRQEYMSTTRMAVSRIWYSIP